MRARQAVEGRLQPGIGQLSPPTP